MIGNRMNVQVQTSAVGMKTGLEFLQFDRIEFPSAFPINIFLNAAGLSLIRFCFSQQSGFSQNLSQQNYPNCSGQYRSFEDTKGRHLLEFPEDAGHTRTVLDLKGVAPTGIEPVFWP